MKKLTQFFKDYFLVNGILWFFCSLSILIFDLNFGPREIIMSIIFPLPYAIARLFDYGKVTGKETAV